MNKRLFDILLSFFGILIFSCLILFFWILLTIQYNSNGIFTQYRVGQFGKLFKIYKLKTINPANLNTSKVGTFLRKTKIDELPQLFNILKGEMSFVGPRPDIAGYYDKLMGDERQILLLKPGLTSRASIKYKNEEQLLEAQSNPLQYNDTVLFPDKVKLNLDYLHNNNLWIDLKILMQTIFPKFKF